MAAELTRAGFRDRLPEVFVQCPIDRVGRPLECGFGRGLRAAAKRCGRGDLGEALHVSLSPAHEPGVPLQRADSTAGSGHSSHLRDDTQCRFDVDQQLVAVGGVMLSVRQR
jgi:hypothetical protein